MIDPISASALGNEFQIGGVSDAAAPASSGGSASFANMLTDKIGSLNDLQNQAADQSQALATGKATDVASVVSTVEQAALSMQLAVQVRNKVVDAYQELMRMQV
jgi:flagellar hook-basal body complex protein FliE